MMRLIRKRTFSADGITQTSTMTVGHMTLQVKPGRCWILPGKNQAGGCGRDESDDIDPNNPNHISASDHWEADLTSLRWSKVEYSGDYANGEAYCIWEDDTMLFLEGTRGVELDLSTRRFRELGTNSLFNENLGLWQYELALMPEGRALLFGGRIGPYPANVDISNQIG